VSGRGVLGPAAIAVFALAAVVYVRAVDPPEAAPAVRDGAPVPAGPEARALLGGLREGEGLVGWTVEAITGPHDGELRVVVGRDGVRFALMVARKDRLKHAAPLTTERYAIFYGHADPPDTQLPPKTTLATGHALARRIRAHEATVTVPGM
jgi:hypothetical protein